MQKQIPHDRRCHHIRLSFRKVEWDIIQMAAKTVFGCEYDSLGRERQEIIPRQAIRAVCAAIVDSGRLPLPLFVTLRDGPEIKIEMLSGSEKLELALWHDERAKTIRLPFSRFFPELLTEAN